jgi:ATP-dependent Clp protease ATP-binding subunit ClpA
MITTLYVKVWMAAKSATWRLDHPVLTSEHLLFACLCVHDQRHWETCRNLPVTVESVWLHLRDNEAYREPSEEFQSVMLGASAKAALERAEAISKELDYSRTGTESLMRALLAEDYGPVRSLLNSYAVNSTQSA